MATVVQDLGPATAYGYAKAAGYTGTEEEFEAAMGRLADDVAEIENMSATANTLPAGASATASYSGGALTFGIPKGDKGATGDSVRPRGAWVISNTYNKLDLVTDSGGSYIALQSVPANTAITNTDYWQQIAAQGAGATVAVGTVTTLDAGEDATVENTGTGTAAVLNFGIPKGADGDVGSATMAVAYANLVYPVRIGTYCWRSGKLYRAKINMAQADASWTASHWVEVKIGSELETLTSGLEDLAQRKTDMSITAALTLDVDSNAREISVIKTSLESDESNIAVLQNAVATKAEGSDLDTLRDEVRTKAEVSDVDGIHEDLDIIGRDLADVYDQIATKAEAVEAAEAHARIDNLGEDLASLEKSLGTKADSVEIAELHHDIEESVRRAESEAAGKADVNAVLSLAAESDTHDRAIRSNADQITIMQGTLATMADTLAGKIQAPQSVPAADGKMLVGNADGSTEWSDPVAPTDEQIGEAVDQWLDDHPEASTTVEDGSITMQKLSQDVRDAIADTEGLSDVRTEVSAITLALGTMRQPRSYLMYEPVLRAFAAYQLAGSGLPGAGIGFVYFADPHSLTPDRYCLANDELYASLDTARVLYENSASEYVLCCGDWLNSYHTAAEAAYLIGRIRNLIKTRVCGECYTALGNHDYNLDFPADRELTHQEAARMWFGRKIGYYVIERDYADCFVFDSSSAYEEATSAYNTSQIRWFAEALLANEKTHLFGMSHIVRNGDIIPLLDVITEIADAYNTRTSVTVGGISYDYTGAAGKFHYILTGHAHVDDFETVNGIPIIYTKRVNLDDVNVDLCYADFDNAVLHMIRIGSGASRDINIVS